MTTDNSTSGRGIDQSAVKPAESPLNEIKHKRRGEPLVQPDSWMENLFDEASAEDADPSKLGETIFQVVDKWLMSDDFKKVDRIFHLLSGRFFDDAISHLELTITFLTVTNNAQQHLDNRQTFFKQLKNWLQAEESPERIEGLIGGLE